MHDPTEVEDTDGLAPSEASMLADRPDTPDALSPPAEHAGPSLRYGFRVGGHALLSQPGVSGEVVVEPVLYRVPLAPDWLVGVVNQRGNIVPVFDVAALLGHGRSAEPSRLVLVLGKAEAAAGLQVDDLPRAVAPGEAGVPPSRLASLPETFREFFHPAFHQEGADWLELDHVGLFAALAARGAAGSSGQTADGRT